MIRLSYLEKRTNTLLFTLSRTARNSITKLSKNGHGQIETRSIHPRYTNLIRCITQGS